MAKAPKKKKAASKASDKHDPDETDPLIVILDDTIKPTAEMTTQPKKKIVAVGQRFWLVPKGHRLKAREVEVAVVVGGEDKVTVRCLDNGEMRVLPRTAFATAGSSGALRA